MKKIYNKWKVNIKTTPQKPTNTTSLSSALCNQKVEIPIISTNMASNFQSSYPTNLNPFGEEEEEEEVEQDKSTNKKNPLEEYPDHLSPFGNDGETNLNSNLQTNGTLDDYDDSLNPFGDVIDNNSSTVVDKKGDNKTDNMSNVPNDYPSEVNPFEEEDNLEQEVRIDCVEKPKEEETKCDLDNYDNNDEQQESSNETTPKQTDTSNELSSLPPKLDCNSQSNSLEPPPVPLPRTKSLLKKRQQQQQQQHHNPPQIVSSLSSTSSTSLSSLSTNTTTTSNNNPTISVDLTTTTGSFQKRKNKRIAPPVPINFKRQVSGSLEAIEEELNVICDKLAKIDKETNLYQAKLKASLPVSEAKSNKNRGKIEELVRKKNSVIKRQKELMYKKREIKLDQIHSDLEYELRMIGNKQCKYAKDERFMTI